MASQNYDNHVRFYAPHHFVFYPICLLMIIVGFYMGNKNPELKYIWWFLSVLTVLVTWLSFMLRQHYALKLQNRIIRLEVAHRYFVLTGKDFTEVEGKLRDGQVFALRFASQEEFILLLELTIKESLSSSEIKKKINTWKADENRV